MQFSSSIMVAGSRYALLWIARSMVSEQLAALVIAFRLVVTKTAGISIVFGVFGFTARIALSPDTCTYGRVQSILLCNRFTDNRFRTRYCGQRCSCCPSQYFLVSELCHHFAF